MAKYLLYVIPTVFIFLSCSSYDHYVISNVTIASNGATEIVDADTNYNYYIGINNEKAVFNHLISWDKKWCDSRGKHLQKGDSTVLSFNMTDCSAFVNEFPIEINLFRMFWNTKGLKTLKDSGFTMTYNKDNLEYNFMFKLTTINRAK